MEKRDEYLFRMGENLGRYRIVKSLSTNSRYTENKSLSMRFFDANGLILGTFFFFKFHGCVQDSKTEICGFFSAKLKLNKTHFKKEIS